MVDIKEYIPQVNWSSTMDVILWVVIIFILAAAIGVGTYFFVRWLKFNKKIEIYSKVNNKYERVALDKAMVVKFGEAGDKVLFCKKHKQYLPMPNIQTGRNLFWYAVREDGEWINIGLDDIDFAMRKANARFLDKEIRYARAALQRNLKDRYDKPGFWEKYGFLMMNLAALVVILVFMWLIARENINAISASADAIEAANKVITATKDILVANDNILGAAGLG